MVFISLHITLLTIKKILPSHYEIIEHHFYVVRLCVIHASVNSFLPCVSILSTIESEKDW